MAFESAPAPPSVEALVTDAAAYQSGGPAPPADGTAPPADRAAVEDLERDYGFVFPAAYRSYLLLGGQAVARCRWIKDELDDLWRALAGELGERCPEPGSPFPLTLSDAEAIAAKLGDDARVAGSDTAGARAGTPPVPWHAGSAAAFPADGCVPLDFHGCQFWTVLATAGPLAGTVWGVNAWVFCDPEGAAWLPAHRSRLGR